MVFVDEFEDYFSLTDPRAHSSFNPTRLGRRCEPIEAIRGQFFSRACAGLGRTYKSHVLKRSDYSTLCRH